MRIAALSCFRRAGQHLLVYAALLVPGALTHAAEHWLVARTEHFEMYSSANEAASRRLLVGLEQFRANFLALFPLRGASEPRTTLVLFGTDSAFRPYKPRYDGKPKEVAGYFLPADDAVTIALTSDVPDPDADPVEVIYHEYLHLLLHVRDARYPLWLDEGLAEVFSTFSAKNGTVEYGAAKERHVRLLQQSALLPLDRLFAIDQESPEYNEENRAGIFYAESWAFTHYLVCGKDKANAKRLAVFARLLAEGADAKTSFHQAFGTDYGVLERALRMYLDGGTYYKRTVPAVAQNVQVSVQPATDMQRDLALLNLRWRVHHDADIAARALALLDQDPNQPRAHELLAAIAADSGDLATAREHWAKAAALNSDNPWIYVQLLREQLDAYRGPMMLDVRLPDERAVPLRAWAGRALALSPENVDAIELTTVVEALAENIDLRLINAIQRRLDSMRDSARAVLALAIIHARAKDDKGARTLLQLVLADTRAEMDTRAAATALRYKLPPAHEALDASSAVAGGEQPGKGIALKMGRGGTAAAYLDTLLAERGTTARRVELDAVSVRAPGGTASDPWRQADELRQRAQAGDAKAMYSLAIAHACGNGVEFSPELARGWLQKAVDHGLAVSFAGNSPSKIDPHLVARFLRGQANPAETTTLPPLQQELETRIAEAKAGPARQPLLVVYRAAARYPEPLQRAGKDGEALVRFKVNADGRPAEVKAAEFSDSVSAASAEQCVRGWRFLPAITDGVPVTTYAEVRFTFRRGPPTGPAAPNS